MFGVYSRLLMESMRTERPVAGCDQSFEKISASEMMSKIWHGDFGTNIPKSANS